MAINLVSCLLLVDRCNVKSDSPRSHRVRLTLLRLWQDR